MNDETENMMPTDADGQPIPAENIIAALNAENADLKDRLLRALAETENLRRRSERERTDASQYAVTKFAREMVTIADTFARALASLPQAARDALDGQVRAVLDGIEATDRQLIAILEKFGVTPVDTSDGKFDPNFHQAIAEVPGNGKPGGSIVDVVQTGYKIGDRLLRPAMVTVARKDGAPAAGIDTKV